MSNSKLMVSTITIPSGASVSDAVDCNNRTITGFVTPTVWTAAALTLEVSLDNVTWISTIFNSTSTAAGSYPAITVSSGYAFDVNAMLPWRYVRFRSGTSAVPVNQAAARSFSVIAREYELA